MGEFIYTMKNVRKAIGDKVILDDVTMAFYPGAKIGVVGPNGAGKSSILKIMAGLDQPSNGEAFLDPGATVGILQQEPPLNDEKTVRGGDNSALTQKIMRPLHTPGVATVLTGVVLGLIQSATSMPFYGGLVLLSAAGVDAQVRYATIPLYATVALSLPTLAAFAVGWVRAKPDSAAARGFDWARAHPDQVTSAATWSVAVLLIVLGVTHMV